MLSTLHGSILTRVAAGFNIQNFLSETAIDVHFPHLAAEYPSAARGQRSPLLLAHKKWNQLRILATEVQRAALTAMSSGAGVGFILRFKEEYALRTLARLLPQAFQSMRRLQ